MSQYPAQPYGVQVQQVPQYGYAQPGYGQPPGYEYGQAPSPQQMVVSVTPAKTLRLARSPRQPSSTDTV